MFNPSIAQCHVNPPSKAHKPKMPQRGQNKTHSREYKSVDAATELSLEEVLQMFFGALASYQFTHAGSWLKQTVPPPHRTTIGRISAYGA